MRKGYWISDTGMGGFLDPPGYPTHTHSVYGSLNGRRVDDMMCLSSAAEAEYIPEDIRSKAQALLDGWQPPALESPEVQSWITQVMAHLASMYRAVDVPEPECWHGWRMRVIRVDPLSPEAPPISEHAGVHLIRRFYPQWSPAS